MSKFQLLVHFYLLKKIYFLLTKLVFLLTVVVALVINLKLVLNKHILVCLWRDLANFNRKGAYSIMRRCF